MGDAIPDDLPGTIIMGHKGIKICFYSLQVTIMPKYYSKDHSHFITKIHVFYTYFDCGDYLCGS
jgi:hypothetical protein